MKKKKINIFGILANSNNNRADIAAETTKAKNL